MVTCRHSHSFSWHPCLILFIYAFVVQLVVSVHNIYLVIFYNFGFLEFIFYSYLLLFHIILKSHNDMRLLMILLLQLSPFLNVNFVLQTVFWFYLTQVHFICCIVKFLSASECVSVFSQTVRNFQSVLKNFRIFYFIKNL